LACIEPGFLDRKLVIVEERYGSMEADYSIRVLQSRKKLIAAAPIKDPQTGTLKTKVFTVEARAAFIEAVEQIRALCDQGDGSVSRRAIREALAVPDSTVRGWLQQLVDLEYLALVDAGQKGAGKVARYRLVDHAPGEVRRVGLLTPEALRAQLR
jgi:hypothetical protein